MPIFSDTIDSWDDENDDFDNGTPYEESSVEEWDIDDDEWDTEESDFRYADDDW